MSSVQRYPRVWSLLALFSICMYADDTELVVSKVKQGKGRLRLKDVLGCSWEVRVGRNLLPQKG